MMFSVGWKVLLAGSVFAVGGCALHMDRLSVVKPGDINKSIYSLDGGVRVESMARVRKVSTVDGKVTLGGWAHASSLRTLAGDVDLATGAECSGDVQSVTGDIRLASGVHVGGSVRTLTGDILAVDALVDGKVETVSGRLELRGKTHVRGGMLLQKPDPAMKVNDDEQKRLPVVVIGPGVIVDGVIESLRGGTLEVSRDAKIQAVKGIDVRWFDGSPPTEMQSTR